MAAMSEAWYSESLERKYVTTLAFDDPTLWTDENDMSYPSPAWKSLDLPDAEGMFHARVVRSGTNSVQWHQIVVYRTATGEKFGNNPIVGAKLDISHKEEHIHKDDREHLTWYDDVQTPDRKCTRIRDNAISDGYQEHSIPRTVLLKSESFQANASFTITFEIRIRTATPGDEAARSVETHAEWLVLQMARMITDPAAGDVEFVFLDKGKLREPARRLYAFSRALKSPAFDYTCISTDGGVDVVLRTEFPTTMASPNTSDDDESVSSSRPGSPTSPSAPPSPLRETFYVDSDYELFHVVLFYLYTQRVCFTASPEIVENSDIPMTSDAEGVYAIARRLLLDHLSKKAFHFLQSTCTIHNITKRVFSNFAAAHEEVGRFYDGWFLERWNEVKNTEEFEDYFEEMEGNPGDYIRVNRKLRKMIKGLSLKC